MMKKMGKVFMVLSLLAFFATVPVFENKTREAISAELPPIFQAVVDNRDFFAIPKALWGCDDFFLFDVYRLNEGRIGCMLLAPEGFEIRVVYDIATLKIIYRDEQIPSKSRRETLRNESISVADAKKLAQSVMEYRNSKYAPAW